MLQISDYDLERTGNCFGVPPTLFSKDTNLANLQAAHRRHAEDGVEPRCELIAAELTSFIQKFDARLFVAHDPVSREDQESRAKVEAIYLSAGVLCPDEIRAEQGYAPAPWGGTEPYLKGDLKTPSQAQADRETAAKLGLDAKGGKPTEKTDKGDDEAKKDDEASAKDDEEARSLLRDARALLDRMKAERDTAHDWCG